MRGDPLGVPMGGGGTLGGPASYQPAVTWPGNTLANSNGVYFHLPGMLLLWVSFGETVGTANATVNIPLPTGFTAVTQVGAVASGCGMLVNAQNTTTYGLVASAGATSLTSATVVPGIVTTWYGFFMVPLLA